MIDITAKKLENAPIIWVPTAVIPLRIRKNIKQPMDTNNRHRIQEKKLCSLHLMHFKTVNEFDFEKLELASVCDDSYWNRCLHSRTLYFPNFSSSRAASFVTIPAQSIWQPEYSQALNCTWITRTFLSFLKISWLKTVYMSFTYLELN